MNEQKNKEFVIEQPNSCEISINAKGLWSGKIKVYAETSFQAIQEANTRAKELQEIINKQNNKGDE